MSILRLYRTIKQILEAELEWFTAQVFRTNLNGNKGKCFAAITYIVYELKKKHQIRSFYSRSMKWQFPILN